MALVVAAVVEAPPAGADTSPPAGTPATVSADPLPTVQIGNGVVWAQVTVGNTVYATGDFTTARPAGSPLGTDEVSRAGLLAYDITTGNLITSFNHSFNGPGRTIVASPDGSKVFVGGDFTTVDGQAHGHVAEVDVATGALVGSFAASLDSGVLALAATNNSVYVGGAFGSANGASRTNLAAFDSGSGAALAWAPTTNATVTAMIMAPDQSKVIVAGRFTQLSNQAYYGLGAVDPTSGAVLPWASTSSSYPVQDHNSQSSITSLSTDGTQIYGTGYSYIGGGNFEGQFAFSPTNGAVVWLNSCHGDNYSSQPVGQVLYSVGHAHDCSDLGAWDDTNPRTWHRALATTTYPAGTLTHNNDSGYADFYGLPDGGLLDWFPTLTAGTYTGAAQAAWSVTGNDSYVALGGEFPNVNGTPQQGLVRFAVQNLAPNNVAPRPAASLTPTGASLRPGTIRLSWQSTWDYDNATLTYYVYRDGGTTPIYSTTQDSTFWNMPVLGFIDTGLDPGSSHTYKITAADPFNNRQPSSWSSAITVTTSNQSPYAADVFDGASSLWRFAEPSGTTAFDYVGYDDLTESSGISDGAAGPITGDASTAATFNGSSSSAATHSAVTAPNAFSLEAWVKTTSSRGGKVAGFGSAASGSSSTADRHIYLDNSGRIYFGVVSGSAKTINSANSYNNGQWHHIVAGESSDGMALYVDGVRVARDQSTTTPTSSYPGYWRVGGDNLGGWPSRPTSAYLAGSIADVAVYPATLTIAQVQKHYLDSGRTLSIAPAPTDSYGATVYADLPDTYWRLDESSGTTTLDTSRTNGAGRYTGGVSYGQPATVGSGTAVTFNGSTGNVYSASSLTAPSTYTAELWFKTTTTSGGKLIGFGNRQTGTSTTYDRQLYMLNGGQLAFGAQGTVTSPASYNNGAWHHVVAAQGPSGLTLYVDGGLVASTSQTGAQNYTGYWRVGGDRVPSGASSNYFAGSVDEVAVYPTVLSAARVLAHYNAGGGNVTPAAAFTSTCTYLDCSVDGSTSSDRDGSIAGYAWNFGDGTTGTGSTASHSYGAAGTYLVTLTVTDDKGAASTVSHPVTVTAPPPNQLPVAQLSASCDHRACSFDGSGSSDPDGDIVGYSWDFGDGVTATGATSSHAYASVGSYTVTLTVTDNRGGTASTTQVVSPTNAAPHASLTASCSALDCSVDAGASTDDATIAAYTWQFGDGATVTGPGPAAAHSYPVPGDYTVTVTVTDNDGASDTTAAVVSPRPAANPQTTWAKDTFNRTVTSGFGSADAGGAWTSSGNSANLSVAGGTGTLTSPTAGAAPGAYLAGVGRADTEVATTIAWNKIANGNAYVYVVGRRVGPNEEYRGRVRLAATGAVAIAITKLDGSSSDTVVKAETTLPGITYAPGQQLRVRFQVTGTSPSTLNLKVWPVGQAEPSAWQLTTTDASAALQAPGAVGLSAYLASSVTNAPVAVTTTGLTATATNTPPTATFTTNCAGLTCTVDASSSIDPQGGTLSYTWSFGDGVVATGSTADRTYAAAGTYRITLTVTDSGGLTDVTTQTVAPTG
jgi:PKD repeat protein